MACLSVVFIICLVGVCLSDLSEGIGIDDLEWIKLPQHSAVVQGQDLVVDCQVKFIDVELSSSYNILYLWMLNGKPAVGKTSIFSNHSLLVPRVNADDIGTYTCLVSLATSDGRVVETMTASATVIEAYIEPFLIEPHSQILNQGKQLVLTCVTGRSAPSLEVYWMRNGETFLDGDQQTASFGDSDVLGLSHQMSMRFEITASYGVTGKYQCVAVNSVLGTQLLSREANVTLESTPSDLLPEIDWNLPEQLFISEGQELVLSCKSQVSAEPVRTDWFVGRYLVDESKRVYVLPNSSLAFLPLASRDKGMYRCRLTNSKGSTWSPTVQLVIAYLDTQFKQEPSDTSALYGEDVVLDCQPPSSLPAAGVIWYKNFVILDLTSRPTSTSIVNGSLHLTSVRTSDQGQYYCVAINEITQPSTRTSKVAILTIQGPPEMTQPPVSTKLVRGTLLHLSCRAVSNPSPTVTWSFEGKLLSDTDRISIIDRGQELWLSNVGREWSGTFTCHCTNKYGSISANAMVTVVVPPSSLHSIGELIVKSGDPLTIVCPVVGVPQPAIQWFHNGSEVLSAQPSDTGNINNIVSMQVNLVDLFVDHVTPDHSGAYTCKGSNEGGVAMSTGQVVVYVLPYFTKKPENTSIIHGHSLKLMCEAGGNPSPSIQWKFNDSYASVQGSFTADNTSLTISHFKWQHVGSYTCVASNYVGLISHSASLKILIPPTITTVTHPESAIRIGRSFRLSCQVDGIPHPTISWNHQGVSVSQTLDGRVRFPTKNVLEIESAQLSDSGQYECQAISEAGDDKMLVNVTVYGPPNAPNLQQAVPLSASSVYLIWAWTSHGQAVQPLSGFKIVYRERTSEELHVYPTELLPNVSSHEVRGGLQPATAYVFYMVAVNDAGESGPSNVLTATTLQAEPSSPTNLRAEKVTAVSAMLLWEIPAFPNGEVKLYQLRYMRQDRPGDIILVNISTVMIPTQEYHLDSLRPYFEYTAQVRAATVHLGTEMWGQYGPAFTFRTAMSDPTLAPQNIKTTVLDPTSVRVSWEKIPDIVQNGPITHYHIRCIDSYSRVVAQAKTNSSVMSVTFHGLRPWRQYGILMQGENLHGKGPDSDVVTFTTLPIAPITVPRNFTCHSMSSTAVLLSWEPLPADSLTCEVTSYEVHLRIQGTSSWNSISVPSNATTHLTGNLVEWTHYEFKMAAFTKSVTPGIGPFTEPVTVRTKEGESGPITGLDFVSMPTSVFLTWRSPVDVKGTLRGYHVVYFLKETDKDNPDIIAVTRLNLSEGESRAHLNNLIPSSLYNISISAVNGAGSGKPTVLLVRTEPYATTTIISETSASEEPVALETTAAALSQQQANGSHVKKNMAAIVAGSIVGSICLIIITVFFCLKCKQYRRKQRLSNVIDSEDIVREVRADSYARTLSDPSPTTSSTIPQDVTYQSSAVTTSNSNTALDVTLNGSNSAFVQVSATTSPSNTNVQQDKMGARKYDTFDPDSALDIEEDQNKNVHERDDSTASQNAGREHSDGSHTSQLGALKKKLSHLPRLPGLTNRYSKFGGEDSVGSGMDGTDNSFPDPSETPKDLDEQLMNADTVSIMSDTLKKRTRMRSESAAAIAALRNSQGATLDDTDVLVDRDIHAEVVFNERTVL